MLREVQNRVPEIASHAGLQMTQPLHISPVERKNEARVQLGLRYLRGDGVEKDSEEAVRLFRLTADASCAAADVELGKCFRGGRGVDKDMNEAVRLFRRAMLAGSMDAQVELGEVFSAWIRR